MSYWEAFLNLLYPKRDRAGTALGDKAEARTCLLCRQPFLRDQEVVCASCLLQVQVGRSPFCRVCGRERERSGVCSDCRQRQETFFQRAVSYGPYAGRMRELILRMKQERRAELLPLLAPFLVEAYSAFLFEKGIQVLVPVPTTPERQRERGFNQAVELAVRLGQQVHVPVCLALMQPGENRRQVLQNRHARLQRQQAHLVLTEAAASVNGQVVCLVDDVYTTGATANACAKKLLEAGARAVYVLTLAR